MTEDTFPFMTVALIAALYFLPAMIANARRHHNWPAIAIVNLFFGWTFLCWVVAIVWAFTATAKGK